jgi:hypothetical protein
MQFFAYFSLAFAGWVFSQWSYNRCAKIGGCATRETGIADLLFAAAVPVAIFGIKNI